ncbi:MAG: GntR family transcriptional regulator [Clostridia bacterium]|nr:GntR family transcriptional regulator [Clostridia bacterium]
MDFRYERQSKTDRFYDFLKAEILSSEYKYGDRFYSIRELSRKHGLSNVTVSAVVSSLVREGLLYSEHGRGTFIGDLSKYKNNENKNIGVVLFDINKAYDVEADILRGIQNSLKSNYYIVPYSIFDDEIKLYTSLKGLTELETDGLIICPPTSGEYDVGLIKQILKDTPTVFINRRIDTVNGGFVCLDNEQAGYMATNHLLERGRKDILYIGSLGNNVGKQLFDGYKKALSEKGFKVSDKRILDIDNYDDFDFKSIKQALDDMVDDIGAIFSNDYIIYKINSYFSMRGIRVPEDIAFVGFNNLLFSEYMNPPLTTIEYPSRLIGEAAAKMIMNMIEHEHYSKVEKIFKPNLIIRRSC